jgi:choloylglycine hydrolase
MLPIRAVLATALAAAIAAPPVAACTRAMFTGADGLVVTGRTMDWEEDIRSNLWAFPRGIARNGAAGPESIAWVSKYGSVIVSGYDVGTADGMNEQGLVANALYLAESDYGAPTTGQRTLSIALWAQYALDNFATVAEAVAALRAEPFRVIAPELPNGARAQLHLAVSDPSGDSAIFEYVGGKLVIHHGRQYPVMTNSPTFDQQLALNTYWQGIGGQTFLPGTSRAADRFVRASFLIDAVPKTVAPKIVTAVPDGSFANQAVASVMSVMRSVSVPLGIATPGQPNIASTLWRAVADQRNRVYFFDSATSPNTFWVPLAELDFKEGAPVKRLVATGGAVHAGNVAKAFAPATPFTFLPAPSK